MGRELVVVQISLKDMRLLRCWPAGACRLVRGDGFRGNDDGEATSPPMERGIPNNVFLLALATKKVSHILCQSALGLGPATAFLNILSLPVQDI